MTKFKIYLNTLNLNLSRSFFVICTKTVDNIVIDLCLESCGSQKANHKTSKQIHNFLLRVYYLASIIELEFHLFLI